MDIFFHIVRDCWLVMAAMAPYLLLGFFAAGVLKAFVPAKFIESHLGQGGPWQVVKASVLGVPIPLCSCSVIPVAASLQENGATRGATISFLASTPQTGVDSILATWGLLGPVFTIFRTAIAFITGCICGWAVEAFAGKDPSKPETQKEECCGCGQEEKSSSWKTIFTYGFGTLPRDIGRALLVGILISGLAGALMPDDFFAQVLGSEWIAMFAVLALGIPLYVCSTGSIPIALAMMSAGLSPGAALVFLITGPATNAATITTVINTMGKQVAVIYLLTLAACALLSGWGLNAILPPSDIMNHAHHSMEQAGWIQYGSALLLLTLLLPALIPNRADRTVS